MRKKNTFRIEIRILTEKKSITNGERGTHKYVYIKGVSAILDFAIRLIRSFEYENRFQFPAQKFKLNGLPYSNGTLGVLKNIANLLCDFE